jgi:hypothetical protein
VIVMAKKCICLLALVAGCATSSTQDLKIVSPSGPRVGRSVHTFNVTERDLVGPTAQLTRYGDVIRGSIGADEVEVRVVPEQDRYRVQGILGGKPVNLLIGGYSGPYRAHHEVSIEGRAGGRHVDLTWTDRRLTGHAGCNELALESRDGVHYEGRGSAGSGPGAGEVVIPPTLPATWSPELGAAAFALLLATSC